MQDSSIPAAQRAVDMVVFDVDGTLVEHPSGEVVWQVFNRHFGSPVEVNRERFASVLAGRMTYADWVRLDVQDWIRAGARREKMVELLGDFALVDGAAATLEELGRRGYRLAAVSGTLDLLVETVLPEHPFERLYSNRISFATDGTISGWQATPFDFDGKAQALRELVRRTGIPLRRMAYVGDDINDVDAARAAGLSIAFRPRSEELARVCDVVVREGSLAQILDHIEPPAQAKNPTT